MTCDQVLELLDEYAAGTAGAENARSVEAHLRAGCPGCAGRLAEVEAIAGQLALALQPIDPSASVRRQLMSRVAHPAPAPGTSRWLPPALAAGLAAALTGIAVYVPLARDRDALQGDMRRMDGELRAASDTLHVLRSPAVQVVSMGGGEPQPRASGRIFWDRARGEWLFYAAQLRPPGPGRTYELWLINAEGRKMPAGTFDVNARGEAELRVALPADAGTIVVAAVTDEPAGGVAQPTGAIQLVGKIESPTTDG